jgi:hypothetical protein
MATRTSIGRKLSPNPAPADFTRAPTIAPHGMVAIMPRRKTASSMIHPVSGTSDIPGSRNSPATTKITSPSSVLRMASVTRATR